MKHLYNTFEGKKTCMYKSRDCLVINVFILRKELYKAKLVKKILFGDVINKLCFLFCIS